MKNIIKTIFLDAGGVLYLNNNGMAYINPELIEFIKANQEKYAFILISDTDLDLDEILKKDGIDTLFKLVMTSGKTHLSKDEPEIYRQILFTMKLKAKEVVFIDNSQNFLDAAFALGINTILYDGDFTKTESEIRNVER
jgi:HAD superfamily hydrolase (TIGR01509 family)